MHATSALANCGPDWAPERQLPAAMPLDPEALKQLPVSAVYSQIYAPFYVKRLMGGQAWSEAVALEPAERRPLLEIGDAVTIWFQGRSTAEFLSVFFRGPVGDRAPEIAQSLEAIGALRQAEVLRRAIAAFGPDYPRPYALRSARMGPWDQPNAFARELAALDQAFGERDDLMNAIADHVCATPALSQGFAAARRTMSDFDRLTWIGSQLRAPYPLFGTPDETKTTLARIPVPYRAVYLTLIAEGEVLNGGVDQLFSNSTGALAPEIAASLREVGLLRRAEAIETGIARLPKPYPRLTGERRTAMQAVEFDALDPLWNSEQLAPALVAYARAHDLIPR